MNDYVYDIETIFDGVSVDGENSFFTYVVDPNPINNVTVNQEDLFTFVRLRAFPRGRSIITSDNVYSSFDEDKDSIYFIGSTKQNDQGYLTTNYTNINQINGTNEGLGIKHITIETAMFTPPIVEIDFVDVRGAAVFNNYEYSLSDGLKGNNSTYNSFFRLPYPIYELTVKGYYGKAVTYYLNLTKFEATVDTSSGDFLIKCKFLGYQFSFLSDIMTKYVISLNNTSIGQKYLTDYVKKDGTQGLLSIPKLLQKYTEISKYTDDFKKSDIDYQNTKVLNTIYDQILELQNIIGLSSLNIDSDNGAKIGFDAFRGNNYLFLRDVGVFGNDLFANIKTLEIAVNNRVTSINKIISDYKSTFPELNDLNLNNIIFKLSSKYQSIDDNLLSNINSIVDKNEGEKLETITVDNLRNRFNGVLPIFLIDFYVIRKQIRDVLNKTLQIKNKKEDEIITKLNSSFVEKIGFNPTVFNVFEILFGNVDIFLDIVYEVCKKADGLGELRIANLSNYFNNSFSGQTDIPVGESRIYPFPSVYGLDGENVWIGDVVGEQNPNFPEIELVNGIINGTISDNLFTNVNPTKNIIDLEERWIPVNGADITVNELDAANGFNYGGALDDLFAVIVNRMIAIQNTEILPSKFLKYAEIESTYYYSKIQNEKIKLFLQNLSKSNFVTTGLQTTPQQNDLSFGYLIEDQPNYIPSKNNFKIRELNNEIKKYLTTKNLDSILLNQLPDYLLDDCFILNYDLTLCYDNLSTVNQIKSEYVKLYGSNKKVEVPYISAIRNIKFIDGDKNNFLNDNYINDDFYLNNSHKFIGKVFISKNNGQNLSNEFYYNTNNNFAKALLFLKTLSLKNENFIIDQISKHGAIYEVNNLQFIYACGLLYRYFLINDNADFLTIDIKNHAEFNSIQNELFFQQNINPYYNNLSEDFLQFCFAKYIDFVDNVFPVIEVVFLQYIELGAIEYKTFDQLDAYKNVTDDLLNYILDTKKLLIVNPKNIWTTSYQTQKYKNVYDQSTYLSIFYDKLYNLLNIGANNVQPNLDISNSLVNDKNLKIEIYNHLKNIYDKWLSYSTTNGKVYNFATELRGGTTKKKLIDHCYFIDRTWSSIGDQAVLNPKPLLLYANETDGNVYSFMSRVLKDNNFNFYNIPTYVNYYNKQDVANMFKPYTTVENNDGGACFIFQYVAGNSKILDLDKRAGYFNDGFDFKANNYTALPKSIKERKIPLTATFALNNEDIKDYLAKYNLSIFRVGYADHNQNIFKEISVSQEEHRETAESILVQNEIAGGKGGSKRIYMGMDLYNVYAVRSYKTTVTCLGNMQILPTQYFQLDNIPLFHGAHMITQVKHVIEPHNVTTTFSGRRISRFAYPVIDKMTTYFNLELTEKLDSPLLITEPLDAGALVNGTDYNIVNESDLTGAGFTEDFIRVINNSQLSPSTPTPGDNTLFTVTQNEKVARFVVGDNITMTVLSERLNRIFRLNSNEMATFGIGSNLCAMWVRRTLLELGIAKLGNASTDAWNWFMGLPENQNWIYFQSNEKLGDWSFEDYQTKRIPNGSLIFGYFINSNSKTLAYSNMLKFNNNQNRVQILRENRRIVGDYDFTPITHIGIYYNNMIYDLVRGKVLLSPYKSFVPVATYTFLPTLETIVKNN